MKKSLIKIGAFISAVLAFCGLTGGTTRAVNSNDILSYTAKTKEVTSQTPLYLMKTDEITRQGSQMIAWHYSHSSHYSHYSHSSHYSGY